MNCETLSHVLLSILSSFLTFFYSFSLFRYLWNVSRLHFQGFERINSFFFSLFQVFLKYFPFLGVISFTNLPSLLREFHRKFFILVYKIFHPFFNISFASRLTGWLYNNFFWIMWRLWENLIIIIWLRVSGFNIVFCLFSSE